MTPGFVFLTLLMAVLVGAVWFSWLSRYRERQRARRAEVESRRFRALLDGSEGVAHDVAGLLSGAFLNLGDLSDEIDDSPHDAKEVISEVTEALEAATDILMALRSEVEGGSSVVDATAAGHVRLQAAMHRRRVPIDLAIEGDLPFDGAAADVGRIVHNLVANAVRAAEEAGGNVKLRLSPDELTITNRILPDWSLDESIYERGVSRAGSTGVGLAVARELAESGGWRIEHAVEGDAVTFRCSRLPAGGRVP